MPNQLETALQLSRDKLNIFPCNLRKTPMTPNGFKDATYDEDTIRDWWTRWPDAGIGFPTGAINKVVVLDIDKDEKRSIDGEKTLNSLPEIPITLTVRTPRGGRHLYFKHPGKVVKNSTSKIGEGLDIRGDGGYVIIPPSQAENGEQYVKEVNAPIAKLPEWLEKLIVEPEHKEVPVNKPVYTNNDIPNRTKIEDALKYISPSCHYSEWIEIGMALHSWNQSEGHALWDSWSRKSDKYEEGLIDKKWNTFKQGSITIATLFGQAKTAGWKPYKTPPPIAPKVEIVQPIEPEEFYYEKYSKEYLLCNKRKSWLSLAESQFKKELAYRGMNTRTEKGDNISEADEFIINLRDTNDIDYAGPLAGYKAGFYELNGNRILVTNSPHIIKPLPGEWINIKELISGLLYDEKYDQISFLYGWLKIAYQSLSSGKLRPGQALAMCGPHNCGKSLLQLLITRILGGRSEKPYSFMTAATDFNGDLFKAEHLCIEDEPANTDLRMRRSFGAQIKQIAGCDTQRCHGKHQQAITLTPFWRLTISLNDEPENLMVLPPIDNSIEDKIILFKATSVEMPMPSESNEERAIFWKQLLSELPAFLHFLCNWKIPAEIRTSQDARRYGIDKMHHADILREIDALSPEFRLLAIIDKDIFGEVIPTTWTGTSEELEVFLTAKGNMQYESRKLLSWNNACGTYLGRLSKKFPERFTQKHTERSRLWTIEPPTQA